VGDDVLELIKRGMTYVNYYKSMRNLVVLMLIVVLSWTSISILPMAYANVPSMDRIRVALFIDTGKYYRDVVPAITLSSPSGMKVSVKSAQSSFDYMNITDGRKIRFGLDQFSLKVLETTDVMKAKQTVELLQSKSLSGIVWVNVRSGQKNYQVVSGSYATSVKADEAASNMASTIGINPVVIGSERWLAGEFRSLDEAKTLVNRIQDNRFKAYVAIVHNAEGMPSYQVRVGDEPDADALNGLRDQLAAMMSDLSLTPVDPAQSYLLHRTTELTNGETLEHYYFKKTDQKILLTPNPTGTDIPPLIQVSEKDGKKYRGMIELTSYDGNMAVINELEMESYLYSVVSSEMAGGWPLEALKAQTVAARTFAVGLGMKYVIAHLSDSTYDQAYKGYSIEKQDVRNAVNETRGQVLMYDGRLATAFYSSNSGGVTSHPSEVWNGNVANLTSVSSPDEVVLKSTPVWYRIMLTDGTMGYVRSDLVEILSKLHSTGRPYVQVNVSNLNFRTGPSTTEHAAFRTLNVGDEGILLEKVYQNSPYSWITGPVDAAALMNTINERTVTGLTAPVFSLQVTKRGPSGRATEVMANGRPLAISSPDKIRTALGSLKSTLFDIEEMGSYSLLGGNGRTVQLPQSDPNVMHVISAGGKVTAGVNGNHDTFFIQGNKEQFRIATESIQYRFIGKGFGHGLGMSQYGAKGLAESGYGYEQILKHYYSKDIVITPVKK
jgi:stage II sporulation protein D